MTLSRYSSTLTAKHAHGTARAVLHATGLTPDDLGKCWSGSKHKEQATRRASMQVFALTVMLPDSKPMVPTKAATEAGRRLWS